MDDKFLIRFNFGFNVFLAILIFFGSLVWADTNGIWHEASDVRGGIFGSDEQSDTSNFTFLNPLSLDNLTYYQGVELDTRYVNEGQSNSITSAMIVNGQITYSDTNVNSVQRRVTGSCPEGQSIRAINSAGGVTCEVDNTGSAGITNLKICSGWSTSSCCGSGWVSVGLVDQNGFYGKWLCRR